MFINNNQHLYGLKMGQNSFLLNLSWPSIFSFTPKEHLSDKQKNLTTLQSWAARHKIEKRTGIGLSGYLSRICLAVIFVASAIFLAIPIAICKGLIALKEKYKVTYQPNSILTAIRKMKTEEEKDKLEAMKGALKDFPDIEQLSAAQGAVELTKTIETTLADLQLEKNRGARLILRALHQKESFNPQWFEVLTNPAFVDYLDFDEKDNVPALFIDFIDKDYPHLLKDALSLNWKAIFRKTKKSNLSPANQEKEVEAFQASLKELLTILKNQNQEIDCSFTNRKLIVALRKALASPVYRALKMDPAEPSIQFLHRLASNIWNQAPAMDAFRNLGETILKKTTQEQMKNELSGADLVNLLNQSHEAMKNRYYTCHGIPGQILYGLSHIRQTMGGFASVGGAARHIPALVGWDNYDSHGTLSNNPSLQGITTLELEAGTAKVHNCYGGSPTIGDHRIAPEFKAVIQAAENNQLAPVNLQDENIPMIVNYNNMQNIDHNNSEGSRTRALMLLNKKYPLSFRGTTFAKDSEFYLKQTEWDKEKNVSHFGEKMLAQLERSFDPKEKGHGFYFNGSLDKWMPIFIEVIQNTNAHFESLRGNPLWNELQPADIQGAYQEYVYSLLNALIELKSVQTLIDRGLENPLVMAINACKENVDRGGMDNTKYLYNRLEEAEENRLPLIIGAMHSRAFSARDRLIFKYRMPPVLNFIKTISPGEFREKQAELVEKLGYQVKKSSYRPHLKANLG